MKEARSHFRSYWPSKGNRDLWLPGELCSQTSFAASERSWRVKKRAAPQGIIEVITNRGWDLIRPAVTFSEEHSPAGYLKATTAKKHVVPIDCAGRDQTWPCANKSIPEAKLPERTACKHSILKVYRPNSAERSLQPSVGQQTKGWR